jgi:hypothetical protein
MEKNDDTLTKLPTSLWTANILHYLTVAEMKNFKPVSGEANLLVDNLENKREWLRINKIPTLRQQKKFIDEFSKKIANQIQPTQEKRKRFMLLTIILCGLPSLLTLSAGIVIQSSFIALSFLAAPLVFTGMALAVVVPALVIGINWWNLLAHTTRLPLAILGNEIKQDYNTFIKVSPKSKLTLKTPVSEVENHLKIARKRKVAECKALMRPEYTAFKKRLLTTIIAEGHHEILKTFPTAMTPSFQPATAPLPTMATLRL